MTLDGEYTVQENKDAQRNTPFESNHVSVGKYSTEYSSLDETQNLPTEIKMLKVLLLCLLVVVARSDGCANAGGHDLSHFKDLTQKWEWATVSFRRCISTHSSETICCFESLWKDKHNLWSYGAVYRT